MKSIQDFITPATTYSDEDLTTLLEGYKDYLTHYYAGQAMQGMIAGLITAMCPLIPQ